MSFSKNRARILPDLRPQAAGNFIFISCKTTFIENLYRQAGKAFTGYWQKAKL
jgi:hypothetical protein